MLYIDEVIQKFKKIKNKEGNIEVCKIGHYGEINEMCIDDISLQLGIDFNEAKGSYKHRNVIDINTPDIGPEPD